MAKNRNCRQPSWFRETSVVECRRPGAGRRPSIGRKGPACARVSAHRRVLPVEKTVADLPKEKHGVADASNSVFLGTAVQTGIGTAVIVCTGKDTACGEIANRLAMRPPETEFGRGIRRFGMMLTWVTMLLVLFVLLVNIIFHRPVLSRSFSRSRLPSE